MSKALWLKQSAQKPPENCLSPSLSLFLSRSLSPERVPQWWVCAKYYRQVHFRPLAAHLADGFEHCNEITHERRREREREAARETRRYLELCQFCNFMRILLIVNKVSLHAAELSRRDTQRRTQHAGCQRKT